MRPLTRLCFALLIAVGALPLATQAQIVEGDCNLGTSAQDLDINNVRARLYNKGNLFFDGGDPNYEVPNGSGIAAIFAGGIWIGGQVNGQVRTAAATYAQGTENYEFYPGPLNEDGSLPNPSDCSQYDKMWKVSRTDIAAYQATGDAVPDLASWPVGLGAPTCIDVNGNGRCDNSSDNPEPAVEITSRDQVIDLGAGQLPNIKGDQGVWWVMNDVGGPHLTTLSPPMGLEVRVLAFAFARADALGDATFYDYTIIYRGQEPLENTFLTIWSDPDLGNYQDDYIGSDPELGLGFVYNADNNDDAGSGGYGVAPPALGYDFFLGPVVDEVDLAQYQYPDVIGDLAPGDRLGMTRFGFYNNTPDARTGNPDTDQDYYNYMRGLWRDGTPWTEGGNGTDPDGNPVTYIYPNSGSPSSPTPGYWSEVCPEPDCATPIPPDDRRFTMSAGPFTMQPGEQQEVVYGIVWAQGADNFGSLQAMKAADILAQRAFDLNFQLAPPPPAPDVQAVELGGQAALEWGYPETSSNYLGSYDEVDPLIAGVPGITDSTYTFEGFNVYRYPSARFDDTQRTLVATYDVVNDYTTIIDTTFNAEIGGLVPFVAARGTNSGVQFYHIITEPVTSYQDYYYGVSAYALGTQSSPKVLESPVTKVTVRPENLRPGSIANSDLGDVFVGEKIGGPGSAGVAVTVIDPTQVTGHTYRVEIVTVAGDDGEELLTYRITDTTTGEVKLDGVELYEEEGILIQPNEGRMFVIDGLSFFVTQEPTLPAQDADLVDDFAGNGLGIVEVANAEGSDPCDADDVNALGCQAYGGNTVWLDPNSTGDYLVSSPQQVLIGSDGLSLSIGATVPEDYEIRFTEACATPGNCLGFYDLTGDMITSVPFELWNVGLDERADDDVRMIPVILGEPANAPRVEDWADYYTGEQEFEIDGATVTLPVSQRIYWYMPDRPDGYELFERDANELFGGPGGTYDRAGDRDEQIDINPSNGNPCTNQGAYIDYCYKGAGVNVAPVYKMLFADVAGDGTTPEPGVVVRLNTTPKPLFAAGGIYEFDTSALGFIADDATAAAEALEQIYVVPNPYRGVSAYETANVDRRVRFVNLPDEATIRIFTLGGTLIRTINSNDVRSIDWDLATEEGLPVASGMYLVHVETSIGDKVIKLGVVNRQTRFDAF